MARDRNNEYAWRTKNLKTYCLTINRTTEKDVLKQLEKQDNKREYIIGLIRKDINGKKV